MLLASWSNLAIAGETLLSVSCADKHWKIRVTEVASGKSREHQIVVGGTFLAGGIRGTDQPAKVGR